MPSGAMTLRNVRTKIWRPGAGAGLLAVLCLTCALAAFCRAPASAQAAPAPGFPPQLGIEAPYAPEAFPNGGRTYLVYELYLTNFGAAPLTVRRIEALDADDTDAQPVAAFEGEALEPLVQVFGPRREEGDPALLLEGGRSMIVYLSLAFDPGADIPDRLRHRVLTEDGSAAEGAVDGAELAVRKTDLPVFGPPLRGAGWQMFGGPDNSSGHRRGMVVFDGKPQIGRRYAIDFVQVENGETFAGDRSDNRSYHAYGEEVLAVADATVISVRDGVAENVAGAWEEGMPLDDLNGNYVTLDLGDGIYARYLHLQPGSLRVQPGDQVRRGQALARLGNSGDSRQPHLHFDVSTTPGVLAGEGIPYLLEEYWLSASEGAPAERRTREMLMPQDEVRVSFDGENGR